MTMRFWLIIGSFLVVVVAAGAQPFFPVKMNKRWGLINTEGQLVLQPEYDAIGDFKHFGYAIMQRQGRVGLLGSNGREAIPPRYEDIKVLDSTLVAVMEQGEWMVINQLGQVVLNKGYQRVKVISKGFLAYLVGGKWGLVDTWGHTIAEPRYDEIQPESAHFFITRANDKLGLISDLGREILSNKASEIRLLNDTLIFYREGQYWGAVDVYGLNLLAPRYDSFKPLGEHFVKLVANQRFYVFSLSCQMLLGQNDFDDYYAFSPRYVLVKKDRRLGLLNWCGELTLRPLYQEIQSFSPTSFRVNFDGRWGVVDDKNTPLIPLAYDYISPLRGPVCVVKQGAQFGVANQDGQVVAPVEFARIELEATQARAYRQHAAEDGQGELALYRFDANGQVVDNNQFARHFQVRVAGRQGSAIPDGSDNAYQLADFEWYYSTANDRWGLRRLADGGVEIEPIFQQIQVEKDLGFTLVGMAKSNYHEFERTSFRFDMVYGVVLNSVGKPVTDIDFLEVSFEDFQDGNPLARCVFSNGTYGLIDRTGRIIQRDLTYIGNFREGLARVATGGKLTGSLKPVHSLGQLQHYLSGLHAPSVMTDYTEYDQLFRKDAQLVCEGCAWGYVDTLGVTVVTPAYSFVRDFVNGAGIAACDGKWGMIGPRGQELIPCEYDGIDFLPNTGNRIVRLYLQQPKYGLIDTLGQLRVGTLYESLGSFAEGRLAVMRNGSWGFVNSDGFEVIPCRFREVLNFQENLAAVRLGRDWGFIDKQGHVDIDFRYRRAGNFSNGLAWVSNESGKVGFINRRNELVIPAVFDRAFDYFRGVARVVQGGKFGLIDSLGNTVLRPRYTDIGDFNSHGLAIVRYGRDRVRFGVINLRGELLTNGDYQAISPFREGMAVVKTADGYGYIDTTGRLVIEARYSRAGDFSEGLATVQRSGQCGYIDKTGREVIPCAYSRCQDFTDGRAVVYQGIRNAGIIDREGNQIVEPSLDRLLKFQEGRGLMRDDDYRFYYITEQRSQYDTYYQSATAFRHGVAVVQIEGKWGIINQKGIEIIPPKYDLIEDFNNGFAKVKIEGYNGLSNLAGETIIMPHYEFISYAGDGLFRVEQGDQVGYFDTSGSWVWDLSR